MGLRSPQQLEQVQVGVAQVPTVEAGKTSTLDLATPVNSFMEQKAIGDQIDSVNKIVLTRKDALSKIKSKYAVESVTSEYKSRIAALVGDNAITKSKGLFEEATRAVEDLQQKAPAELATQVAMDSKLKIQELQNLMTDKMAVEGRKSAIDTGNAVTKTFTMEASSKFEDKESFRTDYNKVYEYSMATEAIKGGSRISQELNSAAKASNSVYEGVKFSLAQKATPDKVDELKKYFEEDILKDGKIYVSEADKTKIFNAFTAAREKTENDHAFYLAEKTKDMPIDEARKYMTENVQGPNRTKILSQAWAQRKAEDEAKKLRVEEDDRSGMVEINKLIKGNRPDAAAKLIPKLSTEGQLKARNYMQSIDGSDPSKGAYSDPKDRAALQRKYNNDKYAYPGINLDGYILSREDRRSEEARQAVVAREVQDKNFAMNNGSLETDALRWAANYVESRLSFEASIDPAIMGQVNMNVRDIIANVRADSRFGGNIESGVVMGEIIKRMQDDKVGVLKNTRSPNVPGKILNALGVDTSNIGMFNKEKVAPRPSHEYKSERQTGGKDYIRIEPVTDSEIASWQDARAAQGTPVTRDEAKRQLEDRARRLKAKTLK